VATDIHLDQRGTLFLQHAQQIMDPTLLSSVPTSNPEESPVGVGCSKLTDPDNINESDDPQSALLLADSLVGTTSQSKLGWVSIETSVPNPLSKFIDIYSDDESPEVYKKTSVYVEEEKGAESVLDTEMPDAPET
jgi:hypothetical protein